MARFMTTLESPGPGKTSHPPPARPPAGRLIAGALVAALVAGGAALSGDRRVPREEIDPALLEAIQAIRRGFATGTTEPILLLVPNESKVYLSVSAIAPEASFYSRDQLVALLRKAFSTFRTIQFMIRLDRLDGTEDRSEMILCPATWTYESHGSPTKVSLRFTLSRRPAIWTLKEIRETL